MSDVHVLYRFYSATGQLLYVGITMRPPERFKSHRDSKEWWDQVSGITVETYPSRSDLENAERRAIQVERPLHNIVHNGQRNLRLQSVPPPPQRTASNITVKNPRGVVSHDIAAWSKLPGWQKLTQALNSVALQANGSDEIRGNQDEFVAAIGHIARTICYMDCCPECERSNGDDDWVDTSVAPYNVEVHDGSMRGYYRCSEGHTWFCWHTLRQHELA